MEGRGDLQMSREVRIASRRRIALRFAVRIRDGLLRPGARLPSIRSLAGRMEVHRNTVHAAYGELAGAGLVESTPGGGVYVADLDRLPRCDPRPDSTGRRLRRFMDGERIAGRSAVEVAGLLARWGSVVSRPPLLVEPSDAFRDLLLHEVRSVSGRTAIGASLREIRADPHLLAGHIVLARPAVLRRLERALPSWQAPVPLILSGGSRELTLLDRLPTGSVVALVTRCRGLHSFARQLLAATHGTRLGLMALGSDDRRSLGRALRVASLLLVDARCARLPEPRGGPPVHRLRVLSDRTRRRLRGFLRGEGREAVNGRLPASRAGPAPARNLFEELG